MPVGERDERLDFLRGLCVVVMVVNHVAEVSPLRFATSSLKLYVTAAEGFVFISGLLVGVIYRRVLERQGARAMAFKALKRMLQLFVLSYAMMVITYGGDLLFDQAGHQRTLDATLGYFGKLLVLHEHHRLTKILLMYSLFFLPVPLAALALRRGLWWLVLAASWALWTAYQFFPDVVGFPLMNMGIFHPAAWQVLFFHALVLGHHRQAVADFVGRRFRAVLLWGGLAGTLVLLLVAVLIRGAKAGVLPLGQPLSDSFLDFAFERESLHLGRMVAAAFVFSFVYLATSALWPRLGPVRAVFEPMGRHSLYSYFMHAPFVVVVDAVFAAWGPGKVASFAGSLVAQLLVVGCLWVMVRRKVLFSIFPH